MTSIATSTLDAEEAALVEASLEHVNGHHPDTVLFVARHLWGPHLSAAELLGADPTGIDLAVVERGDRRVARITFESRATTAHEVDAHLYGLLAEARAAAGDDVALTSLEAEAAAVGTIPVHLVRLVARRQLTPDLLELELRGDGGLAQPAPDTFYYALVCDEPGVLSADFTIADVQAQGPDGPVRGAYYTVRRLDPSMSTVTLWVVVHQRDGDHGGDPGHRTTGAWLAGAPLGTEIGLWGPREGFDPPADAGQLLLVADETGLAAVASIVEHQPRAQRILAVLEVADATCRPPIPDHPALDVRWLHRDGREPGTGDAFVAAVRDLDLDGSWWAFGGAESRQITAVRSHLRRERGWPAERVSMAGYWRRSA
jgi:NADPH-dependent ferric siderophore reductase